MQSWIHGEAHATADVPPASEPHVPGPVVAIVVGLLYLAFAQYVIWLNDPVNAGAGFWPPAGVTLAALVLLPRRQWGWVVGAVVVAEIGGDALHGYPLIASSWWAAGNVVEPLVAASLLRRFNPSGRLVPVQNLAHFVLWGVVVGPLVGACIGGIGTVTEYGASWASVLPKWWVGDGLGVLVVAPLVLALRERRPASSSSGEMVVAAVSVVAVSLLAFRNWGTDWDVVLPYVTLPILVLSGLRLGVRAAAAAGFVVAQAANLATALGYGPFSLAATAADGHAITLLQVFLVIALLSGLVVAALSGDLEQRKTLEAKLEAQAMHDPLTGLPNRKLLLERLEAVRLRSALSARPFGVLFIDLDRFKVINDSLGHQAGDAVLVEVAHRLLLTSRARDTVARFGGDEFVVVCPDLDDEREAGQIAQRLIDVIDAPVLHAGRELTVGASIGIVVEVGAESSAEDLVRDGDTAMYRAKTRGPGRFQHFDDHHRRAAMDRWQVENDLRGAIGNDELRVHYQPIVSVADEEIVAVEALLRWQHPERGLLLPDRFLSIAEETGLIHDIGAWVFETALTDLSNASDRSVAVSMNVSPRQLIVSNHSKGVGNWIAELCERLGIPPRRIWIELTETALLPDGLSAPALAHLHGLGAHLAVDDFGTGYGSLTRLRSLPFDILKIEKTFVGEISSGGQDTAVVGSLIDLAHALGMVAVAEGVETADQLSALRELGCDFAQGFHILRPSDWTTVGALLGRPLAGQTD